MSITIFTVFFICLIVSSILALLKLAGLIALGWLAVTAPLWGFYVLLGVVFCLAISGFFSSMSGFFRKVKYLLIRKKGRR